MSSTDFVPAPDFLNTYLPSAKSSEAAQSSAISMSLPGFKR
jgi:hypothetical protein